MTAPATAAVTSAAGMAAMMTLMPLGVSLGTLMLGGACFFLGLCARAGAILFKKLDGTQDVSWRDFVRPLVALVCMIPVCAAASCIIFLAAHIAMPEADASVGCGGLLLILGLRGLEGFQWIVNTGTDIFMKFLPGGGKP